MENEKGLYWVKTPCGKEDWFVVARSVEDAREFHEYAEGFGENYAKAKFVCIVPNELEEQYGNDDGSKEYWPSHELLNALGFKFLSEDSPRKLTREGVIYKEGRSVEAILLNKATLTSGVYFLQIQDTNRYKIGSTKNMNRRLKEWQNKIPFPIKFVYFLESSKHYKSMEAHLKDVYKMCHIGNEWFEFTQTDIEDIEYRLHFIGTYKGFHFANIKSIRELAGC